MFKVSESYSKEEVVRFNTKEEAERFCGKYAYAHNYGMLRSWTIDGKLYMDCGPRTFVIEEVAD